MAIALGCSPLLGAALFAIFARAVILGVVMLSVLPSMDGFVPV